jgi:hypothetical protein
MVKELSIGDKIKFLRKIDSRTPYSLFLKSLECHRNDFRNKEGPSEFGSGHYGFRRICMSRSIVYATTGRQHVLFRRPPHFSMPADGKFIFPN